MAAVGGVYEGIDGIRRFLTDVDLIDGKISRTEVGERMTRVLRHGCERVAAIRAKQKRELVDFLKPYETGERRSADPSRWSARRDLEWVALRPELVCGSRSTT